MSKNSRQAGQLFDDLHINDFVGSYLNESASICFKKCVTSMKEPTFTAEEKNCALNCQAKLYFSYSINFGDLMNNNGNKYLKN